MTVIQKIRKVIQKIRKVILKFNKVKRQQRKDPQVLLDCKIRKADQK